MKKYLYSIVLLLVCNIATAQVGINTTEPKATLEITAKTTDGSSPEGILLPRLTGDQIQSADAEYGADQIGTLIYATDAVTVVSTKTANITAAGYYFFDGNIWQKVGKDAINYTAGNGLTLTGTETELGGTLNKSTIVAQGDFPLAFTSSATNGFSVDGTTLSVDAANNRVGIGTATPTVPLEINNGTTAGALKIVDGTQGLGKVLGSDADGVASWSTTVMTAFADDWTPASGTLVNPFTENTGGNALNTGLTVVIPEKGWYFFRCGLTIQSDCNDYVFYIDGIGAAWWTYCNSASNQLMSPRDQNRVLYFSTPGTYTVYAGKTNGVVPAFNIGNPSFYLDFVKFQN
ncbi:hypothetical protein SYJ56_00055 [Algoriphagus sp. D3-2-R+10]|uniref:hypothetical protein n=1 Tax=Algoriphagus aurantiacus TaxID=3103948 RepID=UPI002B368D06|nr:hypothetical protein [Algoriphagus sp. D3-2-R+10]MEB2773675.1 hypothetical protein [Algoriphagus sp. D3-2-R+10]